MLKSCKIVSFRSVTHTYHKKKEPRKFFQEEMNSHLPSWARVLP